MDEKDVKQLKDLLETQRREIFERLQILESDWEKMSEHDIEPEEEAQKANLTDLFSQLDDRDKQEIENIDLALAKMAAGTYGVCENCSKTISLDRLRALPAASLCKSCARLAEEEAGK